MKGFMSDDTEAGWAKRLHAETDVEVDPALRMLKATENTENDLDKDNHFMWEVYINVKAFK